MLVADAVLTRAGAIRYPPSDFGLSEDTADSQGMVTVFRSLDSLTNTTTLASFRRAPITLDHPDRVTPENWSETVVGFVVGEPQIEGDKVLADIIIGDEEALDAYQKGRRQLSIGYDADITQIGDSVFETNGPLNLNHIALVEQGKAGPEVRVLDGKDNNMKPEELKAAVQAAVQEAGVDKAKAVDTQAVASAIVSHLEPALKTIQEAATAAQEADAKAEAAKAADELIAATRADERNRVTVLFEAMPFLDSDTQAKVVDSDEKDILVAALGATVPDAANQSVEYLRGALAFAKSAPKPTGATVADGVTSLGHRSRGDNPVEDARREMIKRLESKYKQEVKS